MTIKKQSCNLPKPNCSEHGNKVKVNIYYMAELQFTLPAVPRITVLLEKTLSNDTTLFTTAFQNTSRTI